MRPLSPAALAKLLAEIVAEPHSLDAASLVRADPEHDAAVERILAAARLPSVLRPIRMTFAAERELTTYFADTDRELRRRLWPLPRGAFLIRWHDRKFFARLVPDPHGTWEGHRLVLRPLELIYSYRAATLDALADAIEARRAGATP